MPAPTATLPRRSSLGWWAILSLAVIVFSYVFTVAVAAACALLPIIAIANGFGGVAILLVATVGLVMAITILWSLLPRREEFRIRGVPISLLDQPRLRAFIDEIAARLGEATPQSVYVVAEPNAFVTERGGHRFMGLGLPLLASMSVSEFRAVVAHEFAHFYAGDTRLGPLIYKTRSAMARTLVNLSSDSHLFGLLTRFWAAKLAHVIVVGGLVAYWTLFSRITHLVSRRQEYRSDELACYLAGSDAMAQGLERVNSIGAVSQSFWKTVVSPVVSAGYRPPLADGLQRYYAAPQIEKAASRFLDALIQNPKTSAYDTHPPLKLRLDRIRSVAIKGADAADPSPAINLLNGVDTLEKQLLELIVPELKAELKPMNWDSAPAVWLPIWQKFVAEHSALLRDRTVESIPVLVRDLSKIGSQMRDPPGMLLTREQRTERAASLVWMALTVRAVEQGWMLHIQPGQVFIARNQTLLTPQETIQAIRAGKISPAEWNGWCHDNGLEAILLVSAA